jgi:hypothetical protein
MRKLLHAAALLTVLFFTPSFAEAQFTFSCTRDTTINACNNSQCITIQTSIPDIKSLTSTYNVQQISGNGCFPVWANPNDPVGTPTALTIDDRYSTPITLGFTFPFFDSSYTQLIASTNGVVSFDISKTAAFAHWSIVNGGPQDLPSTFYDKALIMGPYHDLNPAVTTSPTQRIQYQVIGTAPHRRWILSFYKVPLFSCTSLIENTHQIIIYESTGIVEVSVFDKQICTGWNQGRAMIGMQDWNRTRGVMVAGRQATSAPWGSIGMNEIYRFVPSSGVSLFKRVELYDMAGTLISTGTATPGANGTLQASFPSICPPAGASTYIVRSVYQKIDDAAVEIFGTDTIRVNRTGGTNLNATTSTTPSACGPNGSITANVPAGMGNPPFTYTLDGGAPQNSPGRSYTFSGVTGGAHTVVVTDAGGCSSTINVTVPSSGVLTVTNTVTATSCAGAANGSVTLSPQNGVAPFQYSTNSGGPFQASPTFSNLPAGTYLFYVRDASGCVLNGYQVQVPVGPALQATTTVNPPSCNGAANGSITVNPPSNGVGPFTYQLNANGFGASNVFSNLPSGNYFVSVRDAQGCALNNMFVSVPAGTGTLGVNVSSTGTSCTGANNGTITLTATSGSGPYQYSLNGGAFQAGNVITGLAPGTYSVVLRDGAGCSSAAQSVTIAEGSALLATTAVTNASCTGVNNGTIVVTPTNGAGPYTYSIDGGAPQTSNTFTNVAAGAHTIIVRDGAGCQTAPINVTVGTAAALTGTTAVVATSCNGAVNGSITVTPTNGSGPYTYSLNGAAFQASNIFSGLAAGAYTLVIRDNVGCTSAAINATVTSGPPITGTASAQATSCNGAADGTITVTANNGSPTLNYSLDGGAFQAAATFTGVASGSHSVVIRDGAGCVSAAIPVTVAVGPALTGTATPQATSCTGATDGTITAAASNGNAPHQYSLNGGAFQNGASFTGLAPGNYTIVIRDAAGCVSAAIAATVASGPGLTATLTPAATSCTGAANGSITVSNVSGTGPYQYSIDGTTFQASNVFTGLTAGSYTVTYRNIAGCLSTGTVTVAAGPAVTATVATTPVACFNGTNGSATATLSANATGPMQYSLDGTNFQASPTFSGLVAGTYTLYFRDGVNCAGTQSFTITQPTVLDATAVRQAVSCNGLSDGRITVTASGGTAPYQYSIDGTTYQSSNIFNVPAGSYPVYVRDANGCIRQLPAEVITEPAVLTASGVGNSAGCTGNDGTVTLTAGGGTAAYQYSLDGAAYQASATFTRGPGTYTGYIRDANGCVATAPNIVVGLVDNLFVVPGRDTTICEGESVVLRPNTNGNQFVWTPALDLNNATAQNPIASPKDTTRYIVTISLGICRIQDTIMVNVRKAPRPDAGPGGTICFGQDFNLQGSGGVSYQWTPATYLTDATISNPTSVKPAQTTVYSLNVVDVNGCRSLQPGLVTVTVTPPIQVFTNPPDTVAYIGDTIQLLATSIGTSYEWTPAIDLSDPYIANPILTVTEDRIYTVEATTAAGCRGTTTFRLQAYQGPEIYVPNAFTPNGDGKNDLLRPVAVGMKSLRYFKVFNRWGQEVYSWNGLSRGPEVYNLTSRTDIGWNGRIMGVLQQTQTFVWVAEGVTKEGKVVQRKGTTVLIQ